MCFLQRHLNDQLLHVVWLFKSALWPLQYAIFTNHSHMHLEIKEQKYKETIHQYKKKTVTAT
jgi:hypothetical protein